MYQGGSQNVAACIFRAFLRTLPYADHSFGSSQDFCKKRDGSDKARCRGPSSRVQIGIGDDAMCRCPTLHGTLSCKSFPLSTRPHWFPFVCPLGIGGSKGTPFLAGASPKCVNLNKSFFMGEVTHPS